MILDMPAEAFFDAATMTDRVERSTGLPKARFQATRDPQGHPALRADAKLLGIPIHWYEHPFEWVHNRYFSVHRVFEGVPLKSIDVITTVRPLGPDRSAVELRAEVVPSNILGRAGAFFVFGVYTLTRVSRLYRTFAERYRRRAGTVFPPPLPPDLHKRALEQRARDLRAPNLPPGLADRLIAHLATAPDDEVTNMRPFVFAARCGIDRMQALRLFLYATQAGLLDLHWDVLCPNCRVAKAQVNNLADLELTAHCDTCNIRYDVNFDEYVELRFTVSGAVREVLDASFCIGGPYQTRHIVAQFRLAPGAGRTLPPVLPPGTYRWRTRQRTERGTFHIDPAGSGSVADYRFTAGGVTAPDAEPRLGPQAELHFENAGPDELLLILENADWGNEGVSAALVTSLQEFRNMFSSQVLAPGLGVSVKNLTVLFSDLKDSTVMYERFGDSPAYARVRDHFVILTDAITEHNGALVKTIGDAVMAVFRVPADAVAACLAIQERMAVRNQGMPPEAQLLVKLGLHSGPCIAINANEVLDYFGSTVNTAARVQGASHGGDVILTAAVYDDPAVRELLSGIPIVTFDTTLKGLSQRFTLYQVLPPASGAPQALPAVAVSAS
jgi:class 3 adenylate cyclase